jgi:hypothetical protein
LDKKDKLISNARLINQKIAAPEFKTPKELVQFMGAIQSQDYAMAKWAVGLRLKDPSVSAIESSLDKGEIIRIHVLRPTWHFIAADDVYWMLRLSAPRIRASMKSRHVQLELPEKVITKTNNIIGKALSGGKNLTRAELTELFASHGIRTDENRLSHILQCAELDELICSGPIRNNKQTYCLLSERVAIKKDLSKDEALAELAKRYFTSRTPATIQDFAWWSNLSLGESKKAFDFIRSDFYTETIGSQEFILNGSFPTESPKNSAYILPAFDEFLISYKDRSSSLSLVHNRKAVSNNGIFYPPVIVSGQVAGLWQRRFQKNRVIIEINLFNHLPKSVISRLEKQARRFGGFLEMEPDVRI